MTTDRDTASHCADAPGVLEFAPVPQPKVETSITARYRDEIMVLLRKKISTSKIARQLGISRNVIVGIKKRHNDQNPDDKIGIIGKEVPKKPKPEGYKWRGKPQPKLPMSFDSNGVTPSGAKKIHQLKEGECRFSVSPHGVPPDKHRFCGGPARVNSPYCEQHHFICRETVNDRKGKSKDDPARGKVRIPSRFNYYY